MVEQKKKTKKNVLGRNVTSGMVTDTVLRLLIYIEISEETSRQQQEKKEEKKAAQNNEQSCIIKIIQKFEYQFGRKRYIAPSLRTINREPKADD